MSKDKNILNLIKPKSITYPDAAFFDRLASDVIAQQQQVKVKKPFYKRVLTWSAAAVAAMVIGFVFLLPARPQANLFSELESLPESSIIQYIEEQNAIYSVAKYEANSPEIILVETNTELATMNALLDEVSSDELLDYLSVEYDVEEVDFDME